MSLDVLDNPAWFALQGSQRGLGSVGTLAGCFHADVAPFAGLVSATEAAFKSLALLAGSERVIGLCTRDEIVLPPGWRRVQTELLEQFICEDAGEALAGDDAVYDLGPADVPAMLALAEQTKPGPFSAGTLGLGRYIGVRDPFDGGLAAMAGQRLCPPGTIEVSAVCAAPRHRGRGLAGRLVQMIAADAITQNKTPFLHVRPGNTSAIRLYEALGFRRRATMSLTMARAPSAERDLAEGEG